MTLVPLEVAPVGRLVFVRCQGAPPDQRALEIAAGAWLDELAPPALAERLLAWERRYPLGIEVLPRAAVPMLDELFTPGVGVEELAAFRSATHAIFVSGDSDATGDGWLGVGAFARAVARTLGGVVVDATTLVFRPLDECRQPLGEVQPEEVCCTRSLPQGPNRWLFTTLGLRNLGVPEVWFDDVPATRVMEAVDVIQGLRDGLAGAAAAHRREGRGHLRLDSVDLPEAGAVELVPDRHPFFGQPGLRAHLRGHKKVPLGRLLGAGARAVLRPPAPRAP